MSQRMIQRKKHKELRAAIMMSDYTQAEIAGKLGVDYDTLGSWLAGRACFRVSDAYRIMDLLGLDKTLFVKYFPPQDQKVL